MEQITWAGCKKWLKNQTENDSDVLDTLGDDPGACWVGACYILDTLGEPYRVGYEMPPPYRTDYAVDDLKTVRGWIHMVAECEVEHHYFSFFIEEDKATLVHVYGTLKKTVVNLDEWIANFKQKKWKKLFDITDVKIPATVKEISLSIR